MAKKKTKSSPQDDMDFLRKEYQGERQNRFLRIDDRKFTLAFVGFKHEGRTHVWKKTVTHWATATSRSIPCADTGCAFCDDGKRPTVKYLMNAYWVEGEEFGVWNAPRSAWQQIADAITGGELPKALSGQTFKITKTGSGLKTEYSVEKGPVVKLPDGLAPVNVIEMWDKQLLRAAERGELEDDAPRRSATKTTKKAKKNK